MTQHPAAKVLVKVMFRKGFDVIEMPEIEATDCILKDGWWTIVSIDGSAAFIAGDVIQMLATKPL